MNCFCCQKDIELARKVQIRRLIDYDPSIGGPGSPRYMTYYEETTYRWSVICMTCYINLNNATGGCVVNDKKFTIASSSRFDRARTIGAKDYEKWQRKEAAKLGVELSSDDEKGDSEKPSSGTK